MSDFEIVVEDGKIDQTRLLWSHDLPLWKRVPRRPCPPQGTRLRASARRRRTFTCARAAAGPRREDLRTWRNINNPVTTNDRVAQVAAAINYQFRDEALLARALRHASVGGADQTDNERLEFLGDAVIGLVVAAWLFERHPNATEGILTERRARLVSRTHLARVARRVGLEPMLETKLSGRTPARLPDSVVCGALEALIGAIYIEAGGDDAERAVRSLLKDDDDPEPELNMKAALQHFTQARNNIIPTYQVMEERTHAFGKSFCIIVNIQGRLFGSAWGRSKREAEQNAAREALLTLQFEELQQKAGGSENLES